MVKLKKHFVVSGINLKCHFFLFNKTHLLWHLLREGDLTIFLPPPVIAAKEKSLQLQI